MARQESEEGIVNRRIGAVLPTGLLPPPPELVWHVVGAAVQGMSHARLGLPCQDAQAYRLLRDGTLLIALADGAGSAQFAEQGADYAVETALQALTAAFEGAISDDSAGWARRMQEVFNEVHAAMASLAALSEDPAITPRDYAATLTCVAASADRLAVGQVGDGAVIAADEVGHLFAVTRLQRGEYANETHFISDEDALEQVVIEVIAIKAAALAVMSDGLIRLALKMPSQQPHAPFFQPLFRFAGSIKEGQEEARLAVQQLTDFLASERVNTRTDDDKSLVMAVRKGAVIGELVSQAPEDLDGRRFTRESSASPLVHEDTIAVEAALDGVPPDRIGAGSEAPDLDRERQ